MVYSVIFYLFTSFILLDSLKLVNVNDKQLFKTTSIYVYNISANSNVPAPNYIHKNLIFPQDTNITNVILNNRNICMQYVLSSPILYS